MAYRLGNIQNRCGLETSDKSCINNSELAVCEPFLAPPGSPAATKLFSASPLPRTASDLRPSFRLGDSLFGFSQGQNRPEGDNSHEPDQNCVRGFLLAVCRFCLRARIARRATAARAKSQTGRGKALERRGQTL